jgi:hypothetical protein
VLSNASLAADSVRLRSLRGLNSCDAGSPELAVTWVVTLLTGAPGVVKALAPIPTMPTTTRPETSAEAIKELSCFISLVSLQAAL